MTDKSIPDDPDDVPLENVSATAVREHEHVLTGYVKVWEEYEQTFDPERGVFILGPSSIDDQGYPSTLYDCSCGESFTDQREAHQHLLDVSE